MLRPQGRQHSGMTRIRRALILGGLCIYSAAGSAQSRCDDPPPSDYPKFTAQYWQQAYQWWLEVYTGTWQAYERAAATLETYENRLANPLNATPEQLQEAKDSLVPMRSAVSDLSKILATHIRCRDRAHVAMEIANARGRYDPDAP